MNKSERDIFDAILRNDPQAFLRRSMLTLNPGGRFLTNWHHAAITYQLQRVLSGEITRLIINLPPRYLKSIMVSVAFPAFVLGHDPYRKLVCISYGSDLSTKHASDFRSIVESAWYRRAFPKMQIKRSTETEVHTTMRGFRKATSVFAAITGLGGDLFIIDDPQKPVDAQSEIHRNNLHQWFSNTLLSRLDNKQTGAIIVVAQRVHLQDLCGYLTENSSDWTVLDLAAIAETDEQILIGDREFHFRKAGEALHPEHESLWTLEQMRREIGSDVFSAQYQQSPVPPGGSMIKRGWFRYYDDPPERDWPAMIYQSWDVAAKTGPQNDWSVCTTWLVRDGDYFLLDLVRGRFEYPELRKTALELAARFKPTIVLIEDASTGIALAQELSRDLLYNVKPVPVERDKVGRLYVQQSKFESGRVHFPRSAPYLAALEAELLTFPQGRNDDQVDSISQALGYQGSTYDSTLSWV